MAIALALLATASAWCAALAAVWAARRRPLALAALLALSVLIAFEALLVDLLSSLRALSPLPVAAAHGAAAVAGLALAWRRARPGSGRSALRRARVTLARLRGPGLLLVPLVALVAISAVRYPPNNWDSMTYHLARVAHWIQQRSVEPYPTHIPRQVLILPGAEYVLATLQLLAGSDRLASLLQLCAFGLAVLAAPVLARLAGAPRRLAPWTAVLVAALPSGVLQASSTQNDAVAAALALAVVAASLPFLHRTPRWRTADAVLLGVALGAAALVKVTALVAAAPFLLAALARTVATGARAPGRAAAAVVVALAVASALLAPEVARRVGPELEAARRDYARTYLYAGAGELGDRAWNLARGVLRHVPAPRAAVVAAGIATDPWCRPGEALCGMLALRPHEDWAGNPIQLAAFAGALAVAVVRRRRLPPRAAFAIAAAAAAWVLFHLVFRDNAWITRLELPTWLLAGIATAAALGTRDVRSTARPGWTLAVVAAAALAMGTKVAAQNETRPPFGGDGSADIWGRYANRVEAKHGHDLVLREARRAGCTRIGVYLAGDGYDYPLTWRAMQEGREVRHVFDDDPWPCVVFTDRGPLPASFREAGWAATAEPMVWTRRSERPELP